MVGSRTRRGNRVIDARADRDSEDEFSPDVLRQYALLADGERGVLVGPRGEFAWMCAPSWDSDAVFSGSPDRSVGALSS